MAKSGSTSAAEVDNATAAEQRRQAQRDRLRKERERELRRRRAVMVTLIAVITIVALLAALGIGYFFWKQSQGPTINQPTAVPEGQQYLSFGAPEDSGKPVVEVHFDFLCNYCADFEKVNGDDLAELAANQEATIHMVPRRFVETGVPNLDASTRSANAMVCMYDQDKAASLTFQRAAFESVEELRLPDGLSDERLATLATDAGANDETLDCISSGRYSTWVKNVPEKYAADKRHGTPYVELNGVKWEGNYQNPGELKQAILDAAK